MALSRAASQAEAALVAEAEAKMRQRAARQAAKMQMSPAEAVMTTCTVTPLGDGRISMGMHVGALGEVHYDEGEEFSIEKSIAVALYERGFVNFEGAKEAAAEARKARADAALEARRAREAAEAEAAEA